MCVDEVTAEKIAKRKALGRLSSLRRSVTAFRVKIGDDWLFGFVKTRLREDRLDVSIKFSYIDCKGVALERLPEEALAKIRELEKNLANLAERELSRG
ncbi:MAG: hypothetical protein ACK4SY_03050 [Pyrobaculum sp.]